jgi:hypothetical protein
MHSRDVVLGTQNVNTRLAFSSFAYNSNTNIFSLNCTVTNLLTQSIGTLDGSTTTADGVRVFFSYGPFPNAGSGVVTVANADGTGTFNGVTVPFFRYTPFIKPNQTSAAKTWRFNVPATVSGFTFRVEVDAAVPAQNSVLRWVTLRQGLTQNQLNSAWQNTASDIWAVGLSSTILHYDGAQWSAPATGLAAASYTSVWGTSGSDVWAVGNSGTAVHYDGSAWTAFNTGVQQNWNGVWGDATTDYYAVANAGKAFHYDGTTWSSIGFPFPFTSTLRAVWGSDASHVFMVGDGGNILFYNGTVWSRVTVPTAGLYAVWGTASNNVYAAGANGAIVHYNGTSWTVQTSSTTQQLYGLGGTGPSDIWAVGSPGVTQHFDGTSWSTVAPVVGVQISGLAAASSGPLWAVGTSGALLMVSGTQFTLSNQSGLQLLGVWASSASDVWAAAPGTVLHYDGTNWTSAYVSANDPMTAAWGTASNNVYLVGRKGTVAQYNGATWTSTVITPPTGTAGFNGVYGSSATDLYAVGPAGLIEHSNGTTWTFVTNTGTGNLMSVWGGGSPATYFAVASDGTAYSSTNGGSWSAVSFTPANTNALASVFGTSPTNVWTTGNAGTAYVDAGSGFVLPSPANATGTNYKGTWLTGAADVYLVGPGGSVEHFNGAKWLAMPTPVNTTLRAIFGTAAQNVYVVGDNGVVLLGTGT